MPDRKLVQIYTDGSCRMNPGPGGWAAILTYNGHERVIRGGESQTTNNRMELLACIKGLLALKEPCTVYLYSDSKYVIDGITKWIKGWKAKGWKTSGGKGVLNNDLWKQLDDATIGHEIIWQWVKGHNGHPMNERVDEIARNEGMKY